jgi:UDP-2,3-diacylglucosamine hydrolase
MPGAGACAPLPRLSEWVAPAHWHGIDFVSDLHLCEAMPRTFDAFRAYLLTTRADAVFVLGDLFEVWVGDDMRHRPFERGCVDLLAETARQRCVAFLAGNRDFLIGPELLDAAGMVGMSDPTLLEAWGQRLLLSHGDALCLSDQPYQAFRHQVRGRDWQAAFLAKPLPERLQIAADIRQVSQTRHRFDGDASADLDLAETLRWLRGLGATELVHGHTHRPGRQLLAPGFARHVLSDWDLDHAQRAEVLRLTRNGLQRLAPSAA